MHKSVHKLVVLSSFWLWQWQWCENLGVSFIDGRNAFTSPHPSKTWWSNSPSKLHTIPSSTLSTPSFPNLKPGKKNWVLVSSSHNILDLFVAVFHLPNSSFSLLAFQSLLLEARVQKKKIWQSPQVIKNNREKITTTKFFTEFHNTHLFNHGKGVGLSSLHLKLISEQIAMFLF